VIACLAALACLSMPSPLHADPLPKEQRIAWFRDARFGMFIHWGLYSVPAGTWKDKKYGGGVEWIMNMAQVTAKDYEPLKNQFNPTKYDPKEWVRIAKDAGMKYIVITSKHHEGFALWDSKVSDYDVMATPYHKDLLKPLAEECRKQGMKLGFYHSIMDWHQPDYGLRRSWDPRTELGPPNMDKYTAYMKAQLKELLTEYGDVACVWFDGEWEPQAWNHERGQDLYNYVMSLAPKTIVNNRVDVGRGGMAGLSDAGFAGDYGTPEQEIPRTGIPGVDWESCMTMNDTWGYSAHDQNWKSATALIRNLIETSSKGGNYLLNVGPTSEGLIPQASQERLAEMGKWLKVNGEAIYGTTASPFGKSGYRWTQKPGTLYVHVFDWVPGGTLTQSGVGSRITKAELLTSTGTRPVSFKQDGDTLELNMSGDAPSAYASVIKLSYSGTPNFKDTGLVATGALLELPVSLATIHGKTIRMEGGWLGYWTDPADWVSWDFEAAKPGRYTIELDMAAEDSAAGAEYIIYLGGKTFRGKTKSTGGWNKFVNLEIGDVDLEAGKHTLVIRPGEMDFALMNLRKARLKPKS
jgi:alpha-L-fucosidase